MVLIQDRISKIDIYNFEMSYKTPEKSLKSNQIYSAGLYAPESPVWIFKQTHEKYFLSLLSMWLSPHLTCSDTAPNCTHLLRARGPAADSTQAEPVPAVQVQKLQQGK